MTGLSYQGDVRMGLAEDSRKVERIVAGSYYAFADTYLPLLQVRARPHACAVCTVPCVALLACVAPPHVCVAAAGGGGVRHRRCRASAWLLVRTACSSQRAATISSRS